MSSWTQECLQRASCAGMTCTTCLAVHAKQCISKRKLHLEMVVDVHV